MSSLAKEVADRLEALRTARNLSQAEVGEQIGRSGAHISNIENQRAEAELRLSEIEKLAVFFEVHPLALLAGLSDGIPELIDRLTKMDPTKRRLALKLFSLNLELMEVFKNWPADAVNRM
jgi:transcriptional regulator with XRE-family HTH domain